MRVFMYVCMYLCMYVCMYVSIYVCMYMLLIKTAISSYKKESESSSTFLYVDRNAIVPQLITKKNSCCHIKVDVVFTIQAL